MKFLLCFIIVTVCVAVAVYIGKRIANVILYEKTIC